MTSSQLRRQARAPSEVPWDQAREGRVLDLALGTKRRRGRQRLALELCAALAVTFVAGRVLPRVPTDNGEPRPAIATRTARPIAQPPSEPAVPRSESAAKETQSRPSGGYAGTGGHGGAGSTGRGGNAGTG